MKEVKDIIESMQTSRVRNYIIPGLNSYLLNNGQVRMFESTREYSGEVTPHNHRFDFACYVLKGTAINRVFSRVSPFAAEEDIPPHDLFTVRTIALDVNEAFGEYDQNIIKDDEGVPFTSETHTYGAGSWYSMKCHEYHSIYFGRDTQVIFFEGPQINKHSSVLLPWMHNETIETMKTEDWMFLTDGE